MANKTATITANGNYGHHKFTLTVTETATSKANNTSTVAYDFQISPITIPSSIDNAWKWYNYTNPQRTVSYTFTINGTTFSGTIPNYDAMKAVTLKSGTQTVTHNTDGTKTISFSFVVTDTANGYNSQTGKYYTPGNASKSGTLALTAFEIEKPVTGAAPIITASVEDVNEETIRLTGDSSRLIKYHSHAKATMEVDGQYGAAINENLLIIRNGSKSGYGYSNTFNFVESDTFTFFAEDERGYVGSTTVKANMVDYVGLTCIIGNNTPDADGDMRLTCYGNFFNGTFGELHNSLTLRYHYTGTDGSNNSGYFNTNNISISGNTYTAYVNLSGLDYQATYSFKIIANDELEEVEAQESAVKSKPIFHWGENDFTFEVPVKFNSTSEMNFKGNLRLKGDGNYGNTLYFGNGSYCYISEPSDDEMIIKAKNINLSATNVVAINGWSVYGTWTPTLNYPSAVSYYDIQSGWYQRLGDVITIGWQIKAYIESGYENTELTITEIPALPSENAFGGGVAYGIYVPANKVFECWCVDTNARITARLQPCNNTSAGNLNVSSTCYYPEGGGYVTLAGTICYMIA